jgi:ubiquinone biosynthesis protein
MTGDLANGVFSDNPPWELPAPDRLAWRQVVPKLRREVAGSLPDLLRARPLPPARRMISVLRHLGGALGGWAVRERRQGESESVAGLSRRLRRAAEALGPTYIKLGQIISSGEGLFPEELVAEFRKCRDQVPPEPFEVVRHVVERDLGHRLEAVFSSFDEKPLAAASIAQVHAAVLTTGEQVVVKVQRPTVADRVHRDLRVMSWLAPKLVGRIPVAALANPPALVELFAETITEELDFRLEADNMLDVALAYAKLEQRHYVIPRPHPVFVTPKVLVMERLDGFNFDDVVGMREAGVDTRAVVRAGMIGFLEGAMLHGVFHGDLHGGNLFVLADGRTALLDFGITGRLAPEQRLAFLRLLVTASTNDLRGQLTAFRDLGALPPDVDIPAVIAELGLDQPAVDLTTLTGDELTHELQRAIKALLGIGARFPKELMLFVKNMVFLDGAIATLAPDIDLFSEIAHVATYFATHHGERIANEVGMAGTTWDLDLTGIKASYGVDPDVTTTLTYEELQARRAVMRERMERQRERRERRHRFRRPTKR